VETCVTEPRLLLLSCDYCEDRSLQSRLRNNAKHRSLTVAAQKQREASLPYSRGSETTRSIAPLRSRLRNNAKHRSLTVAARLQPRLVAARRPLTVVAARYQREEPLLAVAAPSGGRGSETSVAARLQREDNNGTPLPVVAAQLQPRHVATRRPLPHGRGSVTTAARYQPRLVKRLSWP